MKAVPKKSRLIYTELPKGNSAIAIHQEFWDTEDAIKTDLVFAGRSLYQKTTSIRPKHPTKDVNWINIYVETKLNDLIRL